ncbi:hypothetical protein HGP14_23390 [Rhizobium sp. P32RR-XVIII]|uniref:hypothetical protein n=1 Tax=Rhizobium sp. P32RR-XVIII TaxID=2726738 RepID=UPI001456BB4D|nr:hypothetical protein [Rhizobium sp. P32RR-XVIII]NLS06271.1 hypothetical protein [Rhizobium sp. P32RR-XVIII]
MAIAATDADWKKINSVFGSNVEGVAEMGSIKCRFGDPTIRERMTFEAQFTRYVSMRPERPAGVGSVMQTSFAFPIKTRSSTRSFGCS